MSTPEKKQWEVECAGWDNKRGEWRIKYSTGPGIKDNGGSIPKIIVVSSDYVTALESKLADYEGALKKYADFHKAVAIEFSHPDQEELNDPEVGHFINQDDFECISNETYLGIFHGKQAREVLKKHGVKL